MKNETKPSDLPPVKTNETTTIENIVGPFLSLSSKTGRAKKAGLSVS